MVQERPIKRLQVSVDESGLLLDPQAALAALAALPPANPAEPDESSHYLTVTLDWQPMGSDPARRPARRQFDDLANELLATYAPHTQAAKSLAIDIERVSRYLDGERIDRHWDVEPLPAASQGVIIVARATAGVFAPLPLGVPVATEVRATPIPVLTPLARVTEDYEPYAVIVADQKEATLSFIAQKRTQREVTAHGATYPFRRKAGGNQRRYQARAGERTDQFARSIAAGAREELEAHGIHVLIVAGDEVILTPLLNNFHPDVDDRLVGLTRKDITASSTDVVAKTWPIARDAEREREAALVDEIAQTIGAGGPAVAGPIAVLAALQERRVLRLAMTDDFRGVGWADYAARVVGVGDIPEEHPTGGQRGNLVPIPLSAELVRRAVLSDAEIEFVQSAAEIEPSLQNNQNGEMPRSEMAQILDRLDGVAAMLRY